MSHEMYIYIYAYIYMCVYTYRHSMAHTTYINIYIYICLYIYIYPIRNETLGVPVSGAFGQQTTLFMDKVMINNGRLGTYVTCR